MCCLGLQIRSFSAENRLQTFAVLRIPFSGAAFAHFCTQKASRDEAVTSGDKLSGLEFAGFSGQKTEFGARRTSGKRANLEAQAAHLTPDTKKHTFRSWLFSALFAPKTER